MFKAIALGLLGFSAAISLEIIDIYPPYTSIGLNAPYTYIGNETVACHPNTSPQKTNGFTTYFSDDVYACDRWNHKAKGMTDCFVALNGVCGMKNSEFCDKCVLITNSKGSTEKCRVIDFCDPKNCDFLDAGHLDILNNAGNAHYKFTDQGKYVEPYKGAGGQPSVQWNWTPC